VRPGSVSYDGSVQTELLRRVDLFSDLDDEALAPIEAAARQRALDRGDILFDEGDTPGDLFVVTGGRIAISNKSIDDRESMVALMEPGDLFGEMPLFDDKGRSAEARALEPSSVIAIPYGPIRELYQRRPDLLWSVVGLLTTRLRNMDAALADSVFLDVTGRTAKRLLELAGEADEFTLPITQEELAGMLGASRERVNKAIASFVKLGWLEQRERRYHITNREQLEIRAR
jgi:CRP-like cAMP-binding protein